MNRILSTLGWMIFYLLFFCITLQAEALSFIKSNIFQLENPKEKIIVLELNHQEGWHSYWKNPGESGKGLQIEWEKTSDVILGDLKWPLPTRFDNLGSIGYGYKDKVRFYLPIRVNKENTILIGQASWLLCKESCIPQKQTLKIHIPEKSPLLESTPLQIAEKQAQLNIQKQDLQLSMAWPETLPKKENLALLFEKPGLICDIINLEKQDQTLIIYAKTNLAIKKSELREGLLFINENAYQLLFNPKSSQSALWLLCCFAFLGGLILNIMPCVLPVLSIKVLALCQKQNNAGVSAIAYSAGILVSMLALLLMLSIFKFFGAQIGWGFHLQNPWVIFILATLMLSLSLHFLNVLNLPAWCFQVQGSAATLSRKQNGFWPHFNNGCLCVLLATPCSAPFMASAVGAALIQPFYIASLIFICLGLGLASPFLLIAFIPTLAKALPKPGPWMMTLQKALALPMALSCVWLAWVLFHQSSLSGFLYFLTAMSGLQGTFLLWQRNKKVLASLIFLLSLSSFILGLGHKVNPPQDNQLIIQASQNINRTRGLLINVSAQWCLTCKSNENIVLKTKKTQALLDAHQSDLKKLDWTHEDPDVSAFLAQFGYASVPLYVYYPPLSNQASVIGSQISYQKLKTLLETHAPIPNN